MAPKDCGLSQVRFVYFYLFTFVVNFFYLGVPVVGPLAAQLRHGELAGPLLAELVQREDDERHDDGADGGRNPVERRADRA